MPSVRPNTNDIHESLQNPHYLHDKVRIQKKRGREDEEDDSEEAQAGSFSTHLFAKS